MNQNVVLFLTKAEDSIKAAELLMEQKPYDFSASRAYYAMFYITEALLLTKGLSFKKHSAVIAAFGKEFTSSNFIKKGFHRRLLEAFELRQMGDYEPVKKVTEEGAKELITRAREFLLEAKTHLRNNMIK
ncbi:MAG TPA: HEPN domain-containing protein [Candidatus Brocadiales bacterium]|nr:HEPN domain-containing protein [Candidatus Brocadiales bacterium]